MADSLLLLSFSLGRLREDSEDVNVRRLTHLRLDMARWESLVRRCHGPGELFLLSFSSELTLISGHGSLTRVLVDSAGEGRLVREELELTLEAGGGYLVVGLGTGFSTRDTS